DDFVKRRFGRIQQIGPHAWGNAGIVDEHVDPAEGFERLVEHLLPLGGPGDIALNEMKLLRAVGRKRLARARDFLSGGAVARIVDADRAPGAGHLLGDAAAEPTARAGDENNRRWIHGAEYNGGAEARVEGPSMIQWWDMPTSR